VPGRRRLRTVSFRGLSALVTFSSPSERSRLCQNSSRLPKKSEFFLSWDSFACTPLPFVFRCVHSQKLALPSVRRCDPSILVPPSWFRTTSTACSASALRVCCTPLPACGVRRVSRCSPVTSRCPGSLLSVSRDAVTPFEEFPSSAAVPASLHPAAFLSFPSVLGSPACPVARAASLPKKSGEG
jgi:hypothetical protein